MFHALGWSLVLMVLLLWSLAAWALHAVVTWTAANAGALADGTAAAATLGIPEWLAPWVPAELATAVTASLSALGPVVDGLLALAPTLAGGLSALIWMVWGVGTLALLVLGLFGGRLLAGLRRRAPAGALPFTT
ncbi:MAG: hypothetical protein U1F08_12465 [Steroidobacteraceae bacterium]